MLRYKNSLLERILLEKGEFFKRLLLDTPPRITKDYKKVSMCKQSFERRLGVPILAQPICHKIWRSLLPSNVP
jgi:hypothetical protein